MSEYFRFISTFPELLERKAPKDSLAEELTTY